MSGAQNVLLHPYRGMTPYRFRRVHLLTVLLSHLRLRLAYILNHCGHPRSRRWALARHGKASLYIYIDLVQLHRSP